MEGQASIYSEKTGISSGLTTKIGEDHFGHVIHGQLKTNLFGKFERNANSGREIISFISLLKVILLSNTRFIQ